MAISLHFWYSRRDEYHCKALRQLRRVTENNHTRDVAAKHLQAFTFIFEHFWVPEKTAGQEEHDVTHLQNVWRNFRRCINSNVLQLWHLS